MPTFSGLKKSAPPAKSVTLTRTDPDNLKSELSEHLIVPARLLKVSFTPKDACSAEVLKIPMGWTVRKQAAPGVTAV